VSLTALIRMFHLVAYETLKMLDFQYPNRVIQNRRVFVA
jgi:hypothetical protein